MRIRLRADASSDVIFLNLMGLVASFQTGVFHEHDETKQACRLQLFLISAYERALGAGTNGTRPQPGILVTYNPSPRPPSFIFRSCVHVKTQEDNDLQPDRTIPSRSTPELFRRFTSPVQVRFRALPDPNQKP